MLAWAPQLAPNADPQSLECDDASARTWLKLPVPTIFSNKQKVTLVGLAI